MSAHLTLSQADRYEHGSLDTPELDEIEAHIESCDTCSGALQAYLMRAVDCHEAFATRTDGITRRLEAALELPRFLADLNQKLRDPAVLPALRQSFDDVALAAAAADAPAQLATISTDGKITARFTGDTHGVLVELASEHIVLAGTRIAIYAGALTISGSRRLPHLTLELAHDGASVRAHARITIDDLYAAGADENELENGGLRLAEIPSGAGSEAPSPSAAPNSATASAPETPVPRRAAKSSVTLPILFVLRNGRGLVGALTLEALEGTGGGMLSQDPDAQAFFQLRPSFAKPMAAALAWAKRRIIVKPAHDVRWRLRLLTSFADFWSEHPADIPPLEGGSAYAAFAFGLARLFAQLGGENAAGTSDLSSKLLNLDVARIAFTAALADDESSRASTAPELSLVGGLLAKLRALRWELPDVAVVGVAEGQLNAVAGALPARQLESLPFEVVYARSVEQAVEQFQTVLAQGRWWQRVAVLSCWWLPLAAVFAAFDPGRLLLTPFPMLIPAALALPALAVTALFFWRGIGNEGPEWLARRMAITTQKLSKLGPALTGDGPLVTDQRRGLQDELEEGIAVAAHWPRQLRWARGRWHRVQLWHGLSGLCCTALGAWYLSFADPAQHLVPLGWYLLLVALGVVAVAPALAGALDHARGRVAPSQRPGRWSLVGVALLTAALVLIPTVLAKQDILHPLSLLSVTATNLGKIEPRAGRDLRHLHAQKPGGLDLHQANLYGADLRDADLTTANLSEANLSYAQLDRATLNQSNLRSVCAFGATASSTNFGDALLSGADFSHVDLSKAAGLKTETETIVILGDDRTSLPPGVGAKCSACYPAARPPVPRVTPGKAVCSASCGVNPCSERWTAPR